MSVDLSHSSQLQEIYQSDSSQEDSDSLPDDADESALVAQIEDLQRKLDEQRDRMTLTRVPIPHPDSKPMGPTTLTDEELNIRIQKLQELSSSLAAPVVPASEEECEVESSKKKLWVPCEEIPYEIMSTETLDKRIQEIRSRMQGPQIIPNLSSSGELAKMQANLEQSLLITNLFWAQVWPETFFTRM